ncbi:MAG: M24 family metallopeptidase [Candidatus Hermodarchaeota archaeon]
MNRFEKAQEILQNLNTDGWLIVCKEDSDVNSHFLLGVGSHARHYIYVAANGDHQIFSVEMEANMIRNSLKKKGVNAEVKPYKSVQDLEPLLTSIINKQRIALNFGDNILTLESTDYADHIRAGDYFSIKNIAPNTEFFSAAPIIYELRSVKSQEDLKDMRNVCKANIEILETIPDWIKVGMTEKEVKAKLEYKYSKLGKPAFESIVAMGAHSADPHHNTSNKKIESGVLLIDTGMKIDEMCSDITWTFWINGKPPDEFIQAYKTLYESKVIANKYYTDDTPCFLAGKKCREFLAEKGYDHEKLFFHGFGHSLGYEAHDIGPRVSWKVPEHFKLKENMVYTSEPGLYWIDKWGIRLEDDVIIGKDKCEQLTYAPKDPIII